eukprot:2292766-Pleurochrysis_carterae.AAC.2
MTKTFSKSICRADAHTPSPHNVSPTQPAHSCSSVFSRISAFPREPDSAFCGGKPRDSFDCGPLLTFRRPIFHFLPHHVPESVGPLQHICRPVVGPKSFELVGLAHIRPDQGAVRDSSCPTLSAGVDLVLFVAVRLAAFSYFFRFLLGYLLQHWCSQNQLGFERSGCEDYALSRRRRHEKRAVSPWQSYFRR